MSWALSLNPHRRYRRYDYVFSCFLWVDVACLITDVACLISVWLLVMCSRPSLFSMLSLEPFSDRLQLLAVARDVGGSDYPGSAH